MRSSKFTLAVTAVCMLPLAAAHADAWANWERLSRKRCPSHHVERICGDCALFLVENFNSTLSKPQQHHVSSIADIKHECAKEWGGFGCEATRSATAYQRLGLMPRFVVYGCRHIMCEEEAICSREPAS